MIITIFIIPVAMIVFGLLSWKLTPKNNGWFGYRTPSSRKNQETWEYANKTCGKFWTFSGLIILILSIVICTIYLLVFKVDIMLIITNACECIIMVAVIPYTEIKLKKHFNNKE